MESKLDTIKDQVIITLTHDECLAVASGETISDRDNPFDPMAKVEIMPLQQLDPTYEPFDPLNKHGDRLFDAFARVACSATVLGNNDIRIFVPQELVRYNFFTSETISPTYIDGDEEVIPTGGIRVEFLSYIR